MKIGTGGEMAGPTVVAVDESATVPNVDTTGSTPISFAEFIRGIMQKMMQQ